MLEASFCIRRDEETRMLISCPPTAERQRNGGNQGQDTVTLTHYVQWLLTWVILLLTEQLPGAGALRARYFTAARVHTPALTYCHVALSWTELSIVCTLRYECRWSMLLADLNLLPMTFTQDADSI